MSKGLEALKNIKREKPTFFSAIYDGDMWKEDVEIIEKELKALEIIRNKKVDVVSIMELPEANNVIWYNCSFMGVLCENGRMLTKEEHELLREVLL